MTGITVLIVVLVLATVVGWVLKSRSGAVRAVSAPSRPNAGLTEQLAAVGANSTGPSVLHFSADWCGPCAAVRRVVGQVIDGYPADASAPREVEVDIDEHPGLARDLGVLSLPTTFVLDAAMNQRARIAGVPTAAALRSALDGL